MKTLKTKKVNIAVCWSGLRNVPPRAFPNIEEMEKTGEILKAFEEAAPEFVKMLKEGEILNTDIQTGKLKPEELMEKRQDFSKRSNLLEGNVGDREVSVELENDIFNTFFQQFERWGKEWFAKLEPYLAFRKEMATTNGQSKGK